MRTKTPRWLVACIVFGLWPAAAICYFFVGIPSQTAGTAFGVTWSARHAETYGLSASETLRAVLDDLGVRRFRLPAYWDEAEPEPAAFHFETLTEQMDAIAARGGKATIVVGASQPRWPECWLPEWTKKLSPQKREPFQLRYVAMTVKRFMRHPALERWQVENEPTLKSFGGCKDQRADFIASEILLIRRMESETMPAGKRHPVVTTDSGELSSWTSFAGLTDGRGISVYRIILTPWSFLWRYDLLPPFFYARKAALVERLIGPVFISEFQMEPWADRDLVRVPLAKQAATMNVVRMKDHLWFAERTRLPEVFFWGVEWWAWMKEKQHRPEYWEEMKHFLQDRR